MGYSEIYSIVYSTMLIVVEYIPLIKSVYITITIVIESCYYRLKKNYVK